MRRLFPITRQRVHVSGQRASVPLVYLDHGASTHPPRPVLATYTRYIETAYANVHRGHYRLSRAATERFERVRQDVLGFIAGKGDKSTVVLLGNTSQALDLAAHVMSSADGSTLVSVMEHHSNDLPHRKRGEVVRFGSLPDGTLDYEDLERQLARHRVKLVAVTGASNVTGYMPDVRRIARLAHAYGARILVDAAQLLGHAPIDVRPENDPGHIDFLAAAGHKAYAPFGCSFLYAPRDLCDRARPYLPGGGTVVWVTEGDARYRESPERHEGGTPNVPGAIGLAASLRFLSGVGMSAVQRHERGLTALALAGLASLDGVRVLGHPDPERRTGVVSFTVDGVEHGELARRLDREAGIAVRNGCFCAQPYVRRLLGVGDPAHPEDALDAGDDGRPGAVRATFGIYNTASEVQMLIDAVHRIRNQPTRPALGPSQQARG